MAPGVLGQVVAAGEALGAQGAGEPLLAGVRPVVAGQLVRTGEFLVAARPVTGKGPFTWTKDRAVTGRGGAPYKPLITTANRQRSGGWPDYLAPCTRMAAVGH